MLSVVVLCLCLASAVNGIGNSLKDPYICGPPSCAESDKFKYLAETIYFYDYNVNVETYFAGSSNNRSTLNITAEAAIQFIKPCEGLLTLREVTLKDEDESYPQERSEKFVHAISQYDLRFAFHDGIISEICPQNNEEDWVLNFKRAILSLFQNSMQRFDINFKGVEQDIHGTCTVDYTVRGQENTSLILVKKRDLSLCSNRYKYLSILQTVRYDFQSKFQTWPVLKSESKCRMKVDHNIYKEVTCKERHLFEPFSGKNSGAMSTVIQDLVLVREENKTDSQIMEEQPKAWMEIEKRSNLLHHHNTHTKLETRELQSARDVLKLLCNIKDSVDDFVPGSVDENLDSGSVVGLWGKLVRAARGLHHPALAQLLARAPTLCPKATKHMLDALPYIASAGSVELIKDKILTEAVDGNTRHEWLMSMAMIPRPKLEMLDSMLELLLKQRHDQVVSFTVSSMLHSYCKHSGKSLRECCEEETPKRILEEFQNVVQELANTNWATAERVNRTNMIIGIKAAGNIGGFKQEFTDVLLNIVGDALSPVPIRLAAVDAFRRAPCEETRDYFLETFREDYVNVEVRIASYLQVMKCPTLSIIRKIYHSVRQEKVNQVATFVWSHLNNIGKSSLPSRVEIQGLLTGHPMPQLEDSPDFRMYSMNYEQSVFYDQYNAGGNYETNVVFSPDSYIPRSLSLNLTVDMFGESINLLELKARAEGLERYFESIFGNNGPLSKTKVNDFVENLRFLRSLSDSDEVRRKVDDISYKNEALKHQFPMAELGIKVFGNEISYWNAEGNDEIMRSLERLNPKLRILEILSGKEISYNKASLFLDTTFSVPTGCGLPLSMNLMGTSYANTKMSGNMVNKLSQSENLDFEGKIHPSVAVNIAATMAVTAGGHSVSGIRLNTRLYTATAVEAKLSIRGAGLVRLDLSLPSEKREIFAAKSELIILHGDEELQQQGLNKNRIENNTCSESYFDEGIGIKVCAAYQFPNMTNLENAPYFIMSGPAKYVLSLKKADPSAKTYSFQCKWDKNETSRLISFYFNTPDSKEKRMFNAILNLSNTSSTASLSFQSAKKSLEAKGVYINTDYVKSLEASLDLNGIKHFGTVMSLKKYDIPFGYVWQPKAILIVNGTNIAELTGDYKVKTKGGITHTRIIVEFQTAQFGSNLTGYYTHNVPTHTINLTLDYEFLNRPRHNIKMAGTYSERPATSRHDLYGDLSMEFSAYPTYNFYTVLQNVKTHTHLDVKFNISASRDKTRDPLLTFGFTRIDKVVGVVLASHLNITRPRPLRFKFRFEEIGPKYMVMGLLNVNPKSKDIMVSGALFYPQGTQLFVDGEVNMTLPTLHDCTIKAKLHEIMPNKFQLHADGVWFTGVDFDIDASYHDQSKTNKASHHLKFELTSNHFKDIVFNADFTQDNRQMTFLGSVKYNENHYRARIRYVLESQQNITAYLEVIVNDKPYSITLNTDLSNNTIVNVDIHIEQIRDIRISYERLLTARQKRLIALFNWDANRSPNSKVSIEIQLDNKGTWHHGGHVTLIYPDKLISGEFEFLLKDWFCQWHVLMHWSEEENILWKVKMYSEATNETTYALLSNMNTPFTGWKDTSFNLMWRYHDNLQAINGSMNWDKEYLAFHLLADYLFKTNEFYGEINAIVNSNLHTLPSAAAIAKHRVVWKKSADTLLSLEFNKAGLFMINSSWALDRGHKENNVTGLVTLVSPWQGFKNGFLKTKFVFGHKKDITGVTYLDMEDKVHKINVNGHMRRITNCMLVVNVTSPMSAADNVYAQMTARFGFVEADRHLVAMVATTNTTTGIEILLKVLSTQDFHIFGHVALPIQFLNRAMITAKRNNEEMDFRVGWGNMDFGYTGIGHYQTPFNFVYVYKLYTPLEGFEENGLVLKNVYRSGLDLELSIRLSKHKFGIAVLTVDNGKGLFEALQDLYANKPKNDMLVENFDTTAQVTVDTLYYPTVTFHSHVMKFLGPDDEDIMELNATLHLPDKPTIVLTDVLIFISVTEMTNTLHLVTPYPAIRELKSSYTVDFVIGEKVNFTSMTLIHNGTHWQELSSNIFYESEFGKDDTYQLYQASLDIKTPLPALRSLAARVTTRFEDAIWKMNADIDMPAVTINAVGELQLDVLYVETAGSLNLTSAYLEDYFINMKFKKNFEDTEQSVGGGIQIQQGQQNNYLFATATWLNTTRVSFTAKSALHSILPPSDIALVYSAEGTRQLLTCDANCDQSHYSLRADQRPTSLSVSLSSPHENLRTMKIVGHLEGDNVKGSVNTDSTEYDVTGRVLNREPFEMSLTLTPKGRGSPMSVRVKKENSTHSYGLTTHITGAINATIHAKGEWLSNQKENFTDITFKVDVPQAKSKEIYFKSRVDQYGDRRVMTVSAATPIKRLRFLQADTDFIFGPKTGYLLCKYEMPDLKGNGDLKWSFLREDLFIKALGKQNMKELHKSVDLDIHFGNSADPDGLGKTNAGFRMDLDHIWRFGANASFGIIINKRVSLAINAILPPNVDEHSLSVETSMGDGAPSLAALEYRTNGSTVAALKGAMLRLDTLFDGNCSVTWTTEAGERRCVDNQLEYKWDVNGSHFVDYALQTPLYAADDTFAVVGSYQQDMVHGYRVVKGLMHQPGRSQIGEVDVRYGGFRHSDGHFNVSTPYKKLPWLKAVFELNNFEEHSTNKVDLSWPNKTAWVQARHTYTPRGAGFAQDGVVSLSVPLSTQHHVNTRYNYVQGKSESTGNATIDLDNENFVQGSFIQILSKSERNLDLATTDIKVVNARMPVGIKYIHEYDATGNTDVKQATVYNLTDSSKFNVTGKMDVFTYEGGKNVKLTAIHGNRTLLFENDYEAVDKELKQGSKIKWAADTWINYDLHITNLTSDETESQRLIMNVWYPRRSFNLVGLYRLQDTLLDGSAVLNWNVRDENKTAELRGKWENPPTEWGNVHDVDLALSHPSFSKDVTLKGKYISTPSVMSNLSMELQYSDYENEYLRLHSVLTDNSNGPVRDYKFALKCSHPSTNLDLDMKSDINIQSKWYYFNNYYRFQKTVFYDKLRHNKLLVDMNRSAVQWEHANETYYYKVNGTWDLTYPDYRLFTRVQRPTGNDTGVATLSVRDKNLVAHYNSSDDISYHMVGMIVDTRSAKLDAWRDFDDVTTSELNSYIRLNHSRLLTGSVHWRPAVFSELKSTAVYSIRHIYAQINETLVIIKEVPMESHLALRNIWNDAKLRIKDFLDDLNDLHVIKDDLDEFQNFLNASYNDNDFYVKDAVEFTYYVLDEMALKDHLENLPGIVNDVWGLMGNTSLSIKQSLTYVVDTVKKAYANFLDACNKVLDADFMELVSSQLESMILQYDTTVRKVHLQILEFWESNVRLVSNTLLQYWSDLLKSMEPLFMDVVYKVENVVFPLLKKITIFFDNRAHELQLTPIYDYVSKFGQQFDSFYKDMIHNDVVTNIKKYSNLLWNTIWEKVKEYVPFQSEFRHLYEEFRKACRTFLQTEQVVFAWEQCNEFYTRLKWWNDYFMIGKAFKRAYNIVYDKLMDMEKTALQYEELHRTPKTNFIFDPHKGEILLEQKLPMSWHAFNRTPDFSDIPEYRMVRDFLDDWVTSNRSIWWWYYEVKPYMDMDNVMPPFAGMAMMTGQGTLVTFDKRVLTLSSPGTFLLTKDYRQNNFTVLMESNDQGRYNLLVLTKKNLIHVDLYRERVSIGRSTPLNLPAVVDEYVVDRRAETLDITAQNGLDIQCNLMFRTCKLRVTGWYFASLGGLLGTYNNEQYDDLQLSNNTFTTSITALGASWSLEGPPRAAIENHEAKNKTTCDKFFSNKVSPLQPCFAAINAKPFLEECMSGVDSCALASTYMELCSQQQIPTHVPDHCLQCTTPQGDAIEEGSFYQMEYVPNSTDVIFVVEAQYCNKNLRKTKSMDLFVEAFDSKLQEAGLADNRYAVVGYGGRGVYRQPRSLYVDNQFFTDATQIARHFDSLIIEKADLTRSKNGTVPGDVFPALTLAASLPARAGVPRTVLLLPCTRCRPTLRFDYSTIHHSLMENSVTLHVLMDDDFLSKKRALKYLFGVDRKLAYTTKDYERLKGDEAFRKLVKVPKEKLGFSASLALETNGTIFAAKKLQGDRPTARRFATVFGARAALSAAPPRRPPRCECRAARLACRAPAHTAMDSPYSMPYAEDFDFEELIDIAMETYGLDRN